MDKAVTHQLALGREKTARRKNKEMQANAINMSAYVPIIALTAAAVGWVLMFWERRKNSGLRRQLELLEATYSSSSSRQKQDDATTAGSDDHLINTPLYNSNSEETDELTLQLAALREELEAEEQVRLLNAEDLHLQALKEELEELRKGMQADLAAASSHHTSGRSTPNVLHTPARSCNGADDTDSLYSGSRSPLLQTPSPPQNNYSNHPQGYHHPQQRRLAALETRGLSTSTSGTTTPLTPHSPLSTTQLSDDAWLGFSPSPSVEDFQQQQQQPEVAVTPPLPLLNLPVPFAGLHAALTAGFEKDGSLDLDAWENEEEWLVKTARDIITTDNVDNTDKEKENCVEDDTTGSNNNPTPLIVRPLPKVQVPRLNLSNEGSGTPRGGALTLSARGGIKNNNHPKTAHRQSQLTSRLSNSSSSGGGTTNATPRTNTSSPSGSLTARRNTPSSVTSVANARASSSRSPSPPAPAPGNSPLLFSKSMSAGAAARNNAPTPRLVFGSTAPTPAPQANSATTPNKKSSATEIKAHPLFRSPSSTSITSTSTDAGEARPPTKIPRLQLPLN